VAGEPGAERIWRVAGLVVSQTALLTALLFYFGWARTRATFGYFGVDVSLLGFSTSDYLLRSANSAYRPLLVTGIVALLAVALHRRWEPLARLARTPLAVVGLASIAIGLAGLLWGWWGRQLGVWLPVCLAAGFAVLAYRSHLVARGAAVETFLLSALALLGVFWAVALFAERTGRERAVNLERALGAQAELVLLSKERLAIQGPGVTVDELRLANSAYGFRYGGLRLLIHSDGRYIALPSGWTRGRASAFVIPDGDGLRAELIAP
jgi:hypothetical protein